MLKLVGDSFEAVAKVLSKGRGFDSHMEQIFVCTTDIVLDLDHEYILLHKILYFNYIKNSID